MTNLERKMQIIRPRDIDWENLPVFPFEKLPGESAVAWTSFVTYRDMPNRSIRAVARQLGKNLTTIRTHSVRWHWVKRADDWDRYLDAQARDEQVAALKSMNERHAAVAMHILTKVGARLVGDEEKGIKAIDVNKLSASDIARLSEVATKIERLAREGESDRVGVHRRDDVAVKVSFDVSPIFPQGPANLDTPETVMPDLDVIDQEPVEEIEDAEVEEDQE